MSKQSDATLVVTPVLGALSFWLGCQPVFMGMLAYHKFWLGEGQGYEAGLSGFLGGMFLWAVFFATPSSVLFGVILTGLMLCRKLMPSRKRAGENLVRLFVSSGILGLFWPVVVFLLTVIDGGM